MLDRPFCARVKIPVADAEGIDLLLDLLQRQLMIVTHPEVFLNGIIFIRGNMYRINDEKLAIATVANIHTLLHPTIFLPSSPAYLCEPALRGGEQSQGNPVHHGAQEHRDHNGYICGSDGSEEGRNF